jgi:hypothetical protein
MFKSTGDLEDDTAHLLLVNVKMYPSNPEEEKK